MSLDFTGKTVIVTGSGGGLGRSHALEFARRGANVVVNDLGGSVDGSGGSSEAADAVVKTITDNGGKAISNGSSVTDDKEKEGSRSRNARHVQKRSPKRQQKSAKVGLNL